MAGSVPWVDSVPGEAGVLRRRLARQLSQARADAGLSQQQVATAMGWALSTILRIEGGTVRVSETTLMALGQLYSTNPSTVQQWRRMAVASRWQPFARYRDVIPDTYREYLSLESAATHIIHWSPGLVPELLQSQPYAHAIAEICAPPDAVEDFAARRVALTAARRTALMERPQPPRLEVVLDEGVLERLARGPDLMLEQLEHLRRYVDHPCVTIQTAGHAAGFHHGLLGAFTILQFATDDPAVAFKHPEPYTAIETPDRVATLRDTIESLTKQATIPAQLDEVIVSCLGLTPFDFTGLA